ncbi:MAG: TPM domain-containing protein [Desulfobacterales bacterium]|nr:MAG: TPM domain-containing protein [Desulfobacterales bacterium]
MPLKHKAVGFLILLLLFFSARTSCYAARIPDRPANYVVDLAGIVDDSRERELNEYLRELEQKTTAQMVILTIDSLEGRSIEDFSISVAHDQWKLGQKGKDNGLLLVVALRERKYRIEVGYGLEGVLPDSLVGSIGRSYLVPHFRKGDYAKGIYAATVALAEEIANDAGVTITGMPVMRRTDQPPPPNKSPSLLGKLVSIGFFLVMVILFLKNPRFLLTLFLLSSMGGRRGTWRGSGGRFGGGFGGGGFGSFGGGGASGGW